MRINRLIASLALAIASLTTSAPRSVTSPRNRSGIGGRIGRARSPRFKWTYSSFHKDRSPDESVQRQANAHHKRNAKAAKRLKWQAAGGERTLAERAAAG